MHRKTFMAPLALMISLTTALTPAAGAQHLRPSAFIHAVAPVSNGSAAPQTPERRANVARGITGGLVGGGVGLAAGFFGGAWSREGCTGEDCGLRAAVVGGFIGESIGLALGTHYAAGGNGNLLVTTLASSAIGAAGVAAAFAAEGAAPVILTVTPIIQLAVVLATER
jgi:hypothetical protein